MYDTAAGGRFRSRFGALNRRVVLHDAGRRRWCRAGQGESLDCTLE